MSTPNVTPKRIHGVTREEMHSDLIKLKAYFIGNRGGWYLCLSTKSVHLKSLINERLQGKTFFD